MIAGVDASLRLGSVDLCDCWHQGVIQAGQPGLMQGADEVNVGFGHLGFTCLCVYEDQCVIDAEQPALMQGIWRLSAFSQIPSTDIWAFASALERSQEFLEVVGSGSEASGGLLGSFMEVRESS